MPITTIPAAASLRDRAVAAVQDLSSTGAMTDVDGVQVTTDAVLAEVHDWLLERSEVHDNPYVRAALRIAARGLGLPQERD